MRTNLAVESWWGTTRRPSVLVANPCHDLGPADNVTRVHRNNVTGTVFGQVVQFRDVHNTIHLDATHPLAPVLVDATVDLGDRKGVRVAPNLVLTTGADRAELRTVPGDGPYACVSTEQPESTLLWSVDRSPGAPVVNWRTGGVCGVFDATGAVQPLVEADALLEASRANTAWLDLLEPGQLAAGGWRHRGPALRHYLDAIAAADREHENPWARLAAPPLSRILLKRTASKRDTGEDEAAEVIPADRLTELPGAQVVAGPGAGKSSLVRNLTAEGARTWIEHGDGTYVPVPIRAEDLANGETLPDALARGVARAFSIAKLDHQELVALLKTEPLPGVWWLVLVDALDEVLAQDARERVIRRIGKYREGDTHRFLVTSRPLDPHELVPLADPRTTPTYWLELFSDDDLREFAVRYLSAKGQAVPEDGADDLLARIRRTKLANLAHVPLFATMLCGLYTEADGPDLPANQTQLYRRFIELQLRKLHQSEVMATLRGRVAGWGDEAEGAFVRFAGRLEDVLADIAHDALIGGVRLTPLEAALRWLGPTPVPEDTWTECVTDVLRLSGLFIQYGKRFDYLHHTFEEYFAAARIARDHPRPTVRKLFPRLKWPWPDDQIKVFLAAHWAEAGQPLEPVLSRLVRWPFAAGNVGFLAELAKHGLDLPGDVKRKAVRWLEAELGRTVDVGAWQDRAQWLHDIDAEHAVSVLRERALHGTRADEDRRFQALRFLIDVAPAVAVDVALEFFTDRRVGPHAQSAAADLLHRRDRTAWLALCGALAEAEDVEARLSAVWLLSAHRPEQAVEVAHGIVRSWRAGDEQRLRAARAAAKLDRVLGTDLVCRVIREAQSLPVGVCQEAMEVVAAHDLPRVTALCDELSADRSRDVDVRYAATFFLVDRAGRPSTLLTDLVVSRDFPPEKRVEVALRYRGHESARSILVDVVKSFHPDERRKLWAIEQLMVVAPGEAGTHLSALVRNEHQPAANREKAVTLAARHVRRDELVELYAVLAKSRSIDADDRLTYAVRALEADRSVGTGLVLAIASRSGEPPERRMRAAAALGRAGETQSEFTAHKSIAEDDGVPDGLRVKAALKARKAQKAEGAELVRRLARGRVRGRPRLRLIEVLDTREQVSMLERFVADDDEAAALRLDVAERLVLLDGAAGKRALTLLAGDRKVSSSIRTKARAAAER